VFETIQLCISWWRYFEFKIRVFCYHQISNRRTK